MIHEPISSIERIKLYVSIEHLQLCGSFKNHSLTHTHIRASRSADNKSHTHNNYRNKNPRASDNLEHSHERCETMEQPF